MCRFIIHKVLSFILLMCFTTAFAQVKLNEVMARPGGSQGLIIFNGNSGNEYIELYNPSCSPVNVSGYFIACRQDFAGGSGGSFRIPNVPAAIIGPGGHLVVGTSTSSADPNSVDIKIPDYTTNYCQNNPGANFILANADGWVALFDAAGTPIDAIYWTSAPTNISQTSDFGGVPCVPTGSPVGVTMESAQQINSGFPGVLTYAGPNPAAGVTYSRIPDGGSWQAGVTASINDLTVGNCNGGNCVAVSSINFTASSTNPSCGNNNGSVSLTVTSSGTASFAWSANAATGNSPNATNLNAGTYSVTVTQNGCTKDTSITLTSPILPSFNTTVTPPTCGNNNGSITITVTTPGAATYNWSANASTGNSSTANNLGAGTYNVTITQNGCLKDTIITLNSSSTLAVNLTPTNPTCAGNDGSVTVSLSGGTPPYTVNIDTGGTPIVINIPFPVSQSITSLSAITVSVTVVDGASCQANASVTLVNPTNCCTFTLSANVTPPSCGNTDGSIAITATNGSGNYSYSWSANAASGNIATANNLGPGTYNLTVTDNTYANCFIDTSFTLTSPNAPVITSVNTIQETCSGTNDGSITLSASGGTGILSYGWSSNANTGNSATANNLAAGNYSYTITDANNCQAVGSTNLLAGICCNLQTSASSTPTTCGLSNGSFSVSIVSGGQPNYTYSLNNGPNNSSNQFSNLAAGNYSLVTTDGVGCKDTLSINIAPSSNPLSSSVTTTDVNCFGGNDGTATAIVNGAVGNVNYNWSNSLTTPSIQSLAVGSYSFTATDQNGCTTSASGQVNQPTSLAINLGEDTSVCSIEPFVINAPLGFANYLWNDGQQSSAITAITSGNYAVTVTNSSGCTASDNININLGSTTTIDLGNDITIYEGNSIGIFPTISGNGGGNYLWLPSETLNCGDCKNPVASPLENTTYTLNYTDNNGCLSVDSIQIVVIPIGDLFFPTAFSPNGDGYNDQYKIYGSSVKNLVLKIYNRWGELVFETSNINEGWDGTYKSTPQPIGVYVYTGVATFMNNITLDYKGSITLIR